MAKLIRRHRRRRPRRRPDQAEAVLTPSPRAYAARGAVDATLKTGRNRPIDLGETGRRQEIEADRIADHAVTKGPSAASKTPASAPHCRCRRRATVRPPQVWPWPLGPENLWTLFRRGDFPGRLEIPWTGFASTPLPPPPAATAKARARALTVGRHISFAPGAYAPETEAGGHLLAHELAHTVQQKHSRRVHSQLQEIEQAKIGEVSGRGGLIDDRSRTRMRHIVTEGETLSSLAQKLLPHWLSVEPQLTEAQRAALPGEIRTAPGLAKSLLVYHQRYLRPPELAPWQDGLSLPLPMLKHPETGVLVVDLPLAGRWLKGWSDAWAPALDKEAGTTAPAAPDADLAQAALTNPKAALSLARSQLEPADLAAGERAVSALQTLVNSQLDTIRSQPEGIEILNLMERAIRANQPTLSEKDEAGVKRALLMLTGSREFDTETTQDVKRAYLAMTTGNCMVACYIGLGELMGDDRAEAVKRAVADKDSRTSINVDTVITMMESVREISGAGAPLRFEQTKGSENWDNDPDAAMARIAAENSANPGFYFFGLSVVTGYHSVMLMLNLNNPADPKLVWLDQKKEFMGVNIYGRLRIILQEYAQLADEHTPGYSPLISEIWPLYPPPGTVLPLE